MTSDLRECDPLTAKPKLLFFQYCYDQKLPSFLLTHKREHVECLSLSFDVTVITGDCDYDQVCDQNRPDLTLFESGVPFPSCQRPEIRNVCSHPDIPKLGFLHSDAFCEARAGFLSDMDRWGIETFFTIATAAPGYNPGIANNLFIWPNFVNSAVYQDYGHAKIIPVLFTGNHGPLYPWRQHIARVVSRHYPCLSSPHPGYTPQKSVRQLMVGEQYARMLNSSLFVPACGTVANEVVRKHFEIPACRACLITPDSPALRAAGFVDMKNCVFTTADAVLDKLEYLFDHPNELEAITNAGYELVHSRHTMRQRDQIRQWFELRRTLRAHEKIVQPNPFERLHIVPEGQFVPPFRTNGSHLELLRKGDLALAARRFDEAQQLYAQCLQYYRFMPEPQLRLALCNLYQGNAAAALSWLNSILSYTLVEYKSPDPDPTEWAWYLVALLCAGDIDEARRHVREFPWLRNPELDRARSLACYICRVELPECVRNTTHIRRSIHELPRYDVREWLTEVRLMLRACGQLSVEAAASGWSGTEIDFVPPISIRKPSGQCGSSAVRHFERQLSARNIRRKLKRSVRDILHSAERKLGYFLPYRLSTAREDAFYGAIQLLAAEEELSDVLFVGTPDTLASKALQTGCQLNVCHPRLHCVNGPALTSLSEPEGELPVDRKFDLILIDEAALKDELCGAQLEALLSRARFVLFEGTLGRGSSMYFQMRDNPSYRLLAQDPQWPRGYAIFEKVSGGNRAESASATNISLYYECPE